MLGVLLQKCIEVINPAEFAAPLEEGFPADLYFHYMAPPCVQTPEQVNVLILITFTFSHIADAFVQIDLQLRRHSAITQYTKRQYTQQLLIIQRDC